MQLPQIALPLCSLGAGPWGGSRGCGENEGISAKCILFRFDQLQSCESSEEKNQVLMALNSVITLSGL